MISLALSRRSASGFRLMSTRPLLRVVLVPSTPMKVERLSTAGSCRITRARACCRSAMAGNEIDCGRLGDAQDDAGVLHREEALGHDDIEEHRQDQGGHRHQQRRRSGA